MSKRKTVKRSISLREDVFETANSMADKYFGGNFSAYLTYLICADKYNVTREISVEPNEVIDKGKLIDNINQYEKNDENEDYINSILNM